MSAETDEPIKIAWDDLKSRKVDQRLKEQEAVERNRRQAEMNPLTTTADAPSKTSIWYNSVFVMACFGLLGGLLAWGGGEALRFRANPRIEAQQGLAEINDFIARKGSGQMPKAEADRAIAALKSEYADNPFLAVLADDSLTSDQRNAKLDQVDKEQRMKDLVANLISFGLSGMLIAICLAIGDPLVDRNFSAATLNGFVAAACGLVGGAAVSLIDKSVYDFIFKWATAHQGNYLAWATTAADAAEWGVLGLFLTIGPGLVMWNLKKLFIGLIGGAIGGVMGGVMHGYIYSSTGNDDMGRLAAMVAIGLCAGLGTGLIENAAKNGWLRVTAGLIAGKQFILYRNPTFIGSGPECPIYLFRDPLVGKRHAAIHIVPGGFELENLPLGADTIINGKPVTRTRLRAGDEIRIGITSFTFQEKTRQA